MKYTIKDIIKKTGLTKAAVNNKANQIEKEYPHEFENGKFPNSKKVFSEKAYDKIIELIAETKRGRPATVPIKDKLIKIIPGAENMTKEEIVKEVEKNL